MYHELNIPYMLYIKTGSFACPIPTAVSKSSPGSTNLMLEYLSAGSIPGGKHLQFSYEEKLYNLNPEMFLQLIYLIDLWLQLNANCPILFHIKASWECIPIQSSLAGYISFLILADLLGWHIFFKSNSGPTQTYRHPPPSLVVVWITVGHIPFQWAVSCLVDFIMCCLLLHLFENVESSLSQFLFYVGGSSESS